ncbi:MAG: DNA polymerase I, partial [Verrucomicrobia bacterium]|nr:DNA polymerase I [Verrucomicrobiota bacterium]
MSHAQTFESPAKRTLLLVDGHAYAYRAFFAIRQMSGPDGSATNGIYGFIKMLQRNTFGCKTSIPNNSNVGRLHERDHSLLPGYKAERPAMPEDLDHQIDDMRSFLATAGFASAVIPGIEADDLIATLALEADRSGYSVVIASSDKDFMQLVNSNIGLLNPGDKNQRIWGVAEVFEKTGVQPHQIVEWLSLIGDAVDNIPGVAGVGHKTATELLQQYGSVDGILSHAHEVTGPKRRDALLASKELLERNRQL